MRVLLYSENLEKIKRSGLGKSIQHQQKALQEVGIEFTTDLKEPYDILHINTYFLSSFLLALKCRLKGIPVVYHAHSTEEDFRNSFRFSNILAPFFKQWLILCYKLGNVIITPTPYSKRLLESYHLNRPIYAISNGIDLTQFQINDRKYASKSFRQKYHYKDSDFVVMGIGLYLKRKGLLDFVELAKRMPHVHFIWFGELDLALVPQEIKDAITTQLDNLIFAGYVPNEEIKQALLATDLYIFPTYEETEGIPAIEACAMKANFIVRDIPVFEGWLEDKINVYKAKNIEEFQQLIDRFYRRELPSLGEAAYQVALERSIPTIGLQLKKVYQIAYEKIKH
ncbi:glycosyltransferase family 4 protein [Facklamia sp. DSM 111018]|uniref:Glycosyltransferase family 4 protein n=1 Tax=Facklamia lactis TaxID=2749967 RepID=A0ABS0LQ58_9LACT|nr:glycosyltransferase family 4 protein [Facklamia lactis]MBG9980495.1 glycosyltransferase family 4 protein [Facklamia lactis]MBG9986287.1 glycosyltransferase family 4 protein [Facklamia lactis]